MNLRSPWILFCLFCFQLLPLGAEFRTFKNDFGDTVDAELVELKDADTIVTLKLRNGKEIDAVVTAFSQADQKFGRRNHPQTRFEKQIPHEHGCDFRLQSRRDV